ncbi:MAG: hypothetical protein CL920_01970 [Deltaproteobacteria bacterium]|nr:hypothetical protein [Deltaproteobacteria bacterium]MBU47447.1 hypothetical protein [Deltaproteobacteria bacterium]
MSTIRFFVVGILCVFVAAGCSYTTVTGEVVDLKGVPVEGAVIKLYHTEKKKVLGKTDAKGRFSITMRDICLPICGGGHPSVKASKKGYQSVQAIALWGKAMKKRLKLQRLSVGTPRRTKPAEAQKKTPPVAPKSKAKEKPDAR